MPDTRRINMRKIRDVLRLKLDARLSHEQTAAALGISKGVITKYLSPWPAPQAWTGHKSRSWMKLRCTTASWAYPSAPAALSCPTMARSTRSWAAKA